MTLLLYSPAVQRIGRPALTDRTFAIAVTVIYSACVLAAGLHHEGWRDEADAWLAARDLPMGQWFSWLGGAGTPGLWYVLILPLARSGLPYLSMTLLHVGLAIGV